MEKRFGAVLLSLVMLFTSCCTARKKAEEEPTVPPKREGVALIITGAAARIPQEAALLEELDMRGLLKDVVFISGDSSGALNAVMLNGVLSGRMTWTQYKNILFSLKNEDIFLRSGKRLPVDTSPARRLYSRVVEDTFGYKTIGELPIATSITITRLKDLGLRKTAYRMCSKKINAESDPSLGLVDILMATSSVPVVFPPAKIAGATTIPDIDYVDGGAGEDYVPYAALLEFEKYRGLGVDKVYIVSRASDRVPELSEELKELGVNDHKFFDDLGISFDALANRKLRERLDAYREEAPELAERTYIWRPEFKQSFLLFDFSHLKDQYTATSDWAKTHDPVPLSEYLAAHPEKR
jgi:predicted acylesterase/phospholipase RssA